jgi:hypothetical protein
MYGDGMSPRDSAAERMGYKVKKPWSLKRHLWTWIPVFLVLVAGIPIAGIAISQATLGVRSSIQERNIVNNPLNRIYEYNHFYDLRATFVSQLAAIRNNKAQLAQYQKMEAGQPDPTGQIGSTLAQDQSAVSGAESLCASTAQQYTQDAQKIATGGQFKDKNLPFSLDFNQCAHQP